MKKIFPLLIMTLFLFACSGNSEPTKKAESMETETLVEDESLTNLENQASKIIDEAEALENEVDELLKDI